MKTALVIAAVVLQVAALAFMAGEREWIVRNGRTVYLQTAPIDPNDPMRGDYVRLNYEIGTVPCWKAAALAAATNALGQLPRDLKVYAVLKTNESGVAEIVSVEPSCPKGGMVIRGFLTGYNDNWTSMRWLSVRYGIEAFFMEQGTALDLENSMRNRDAQGRLEMEVALSPRGIAVLKGFRKSPLAIGLDVVQTNINRRTVLLSATVRLVNVSSNDLAIVDLPAGASFGLISANQGWRQGSWQWINADAPAPAPRAEDVVVLKPNQAHTNRFDFTEPRWFVFDSSSPTGREHAVSLSSEQITWQSFRLEYRAPDPAMSATLPNANIIWHGTLPSRAFFTTGRVD